MYDAYDASGTHSKTIALIKQPRSRRQRSETPVGAHLQNVAQQIQDFRATLRQSVYLRSWLPPAICGDVWISSSSVGYSVQLNFRPSKSSVVFICCQYPYVPTNSTLARSCQRSLRAVPDLSVLKFGMQFRP